MKAVRGGDRVIPAPHGDDVRVLDPGRESGHGALEEAQAVDA